MKLVQWIYFDLVKGKSYQIDGKNESKLCILPQTPFYIKDDLAFQGCTQQTNRFSFNNGYICFLNYQEVIQSARRTVP